MSAKNILQEYFQKRGQPVPTYVTQMAGGESHAPRWRSRVNLPTGQTFSREVSGTRRGAETAAAQTALEALGLWGSSSDVEAGKATGVEAGKVTGGSKANVSSTTKPPDDTFVFVDTATAVVDVGGDQVFRFYSGPAPPGHKDNPNEIYVASSRKNAVAARIAVELGMSAALEEAEKFVVVSADHAVIPAAAEQLRALDYDVQQVAALPATRPAGEAAGEYPRRGRRRGGH